MRALKSTLKISTAISTAALLLSFVAGGAMAAPKPGGHPGGGRPGGGGAHFAPHVGGAPRGVAHFAAPRANHFATHVGRPAFRGRTNTHVGTIHAAPSVVHAPNGVSAAQRTVPDVRSNAALHTTTSRVTGTTDPRNFRSHRNFAGDPAFRPFRGVGWHPHHHLGWVGPLFWPYAYGDLFYDALWPYDYAYYDPFWYYGYGDIYEGIFSPYNYDEYVQGPNAPERMTALTQSVAQSCTDEAAEVTGWPIDQIQAAVQPNAEQGRLLDDLGNAVVKAGDAIKSHCPTRVSFTPTDRLADMQQRLEGMVQGVNIVQPPLAKFYDALSDEQKARFNDVGNASGRPPRRSQQAAANPESQCGENAMAFPTDRIDQAVHPTDAQRVKLDALQSASGKAVDLIKAACPTELPATPPSRLAAEGKRLQAMLEAVQTIRPALDDFYSSLSDDQKAKFNTIGRQLFAENGEE
jgi:LTXXQ motif family protein